MRDANTTIWSGAWGRIGRRQLESQERVRELRALLDRIELRGDEIVLDIGAGPGLLTLGFAELLPNGKAVGLDLSRDMLARLRENAAARRLSRRITTVEADAVDTGLAEESVDIAVSNKLLHELCDLDELTRELYRVLKHGGRVYLRDFRRTLISRVMVRIFHGSEVIGAQTAADLEASLRRAGFENIRVEPDGSAQIASAQKPQAGDPPLSR